MCKKSDECIDHLFLHCEVAKELSSSLFQLFGVVWVVPQRVRELLMNWRGQFLEFAKFLALKCYYRLHMLLDFIYRFDNFTLVVKDHKFQAPVGLSLAFYEY